MTSHRKNILLASSSVYRAELLRRVNLDFSVVSPSFQETHEVVENPRELAIRMALGKADSVADHYKGSLIIGSDQVAHLGGEILHKPGGFDTARQQLSAASGKWMTFTTSIVLLEESTNTRITEEMILILSTVSLLYC